MASRNAALGELGGDVDLVNLVAAVAVMQLRSAQPSPRLGGPQTVAHASMNGAGALGDMSSSLQPARILAMADVAASLGLGDATKLASAWGSIRLPAVTMLLCSRMVEPRQYLGACGV